MKFCLSVILEFTLNPPERALSVTRGVTDTVKKTLFFDETDPQEKRLHIYNTRQRSELPRLPRSLPWSWYANLDVA